MSLMRERMRTVALAILLAVMSIAGPGWLLYSASGQPTQPAPLVPAPAELDSVGRVNTPNFTVTATSLRKADLVAHAAEKARLDLAQRWLGKPLPDWSHLCPLAVRQGGNKGHSVLEFEQDKVFSRRIEVSGDLDQILGVTLPHEIMHNILADHFGKPIPRWADEGIAMLVEDATSQEQYRRTLLNLVRMQELPVALPTLLGQMDFPKVKLVEFAACSFGLCEYLVSLKSPRVLLALIQDGPTRGWPAALDEHYKIPSIAALEKAWLAAVQKNAPNFTIQADLRAVIPAHQPAVLASLSRDERLVLIRRYLPGSITLEDGMATPIDRVTARTVTGTKLTATQVRDRLREGPLVVLLEDETPLPESYRKLFRDETLVIAVAARPALEYSAQIQRAVREGRPLPGVEPPSDDEILKAGRATKPGVSDVSIVKEIVADRLGPERTYYLFGLAMMRKLQFKCTLNYTDETGKKQVEVIFIDRQYIHANEPAW